MGHIARHCLQIRDQIKKEKNNRLHAHVVEENEHIPNKERE